MGLLFVGIPATLSKVGLAGVVSGSKFSHANRQGLLAFTRDAFTPYLNTTFRVATDSGTTSLKLIATTDLKRSLLSSRIAGKESFSLLFERSASKAFTQDTYVVEHGALGKFSLFLVPVGSESGEHYEAIFTRL
jgi:hypothetical protein